MVSVCFFFNDTATTEIYTLSLHDALPIFSDKGAEQRHERQAGREHHGHHHKDPTGDEDEHEGGVPPDRLQTVVTEEPAVGGLSPDRKSTRLNSSHANISYAVFCLKKKK